MVMKYCSSGNNACERRDDIHFPEFEREGSDLASQARQVILIRLCDFLDQSMFSQSLEKPGDLMRLFADQHRADVAVLKSADVELASEDGPEKLRVIAVKKTESPIAFESLLS